MKRLSKRFVCAVLAAAMALSISSVPAHAAQLPETITINGKEYVMDATAGGGSGSAIADNPMSMARAGFVVLGSDVRLYIDYGHGQGGDHFSSGWVEATAPTFYARAEVWANGRIEAAGLNTKNNGSISYATSFLALGIVKNAEPRIFYNW